MNICEGKGLPLKETEKLDSYFVIYSFLCEIMLG